VYTILGGGGGSLISVQPNFLAVSMSTVSGAEVINFFKYFLAIVVLFIILPPLGAIY
jgi:hypothetical protein